MKSLSMVIIFLITVTTTLQAQQRRSIAIGENIRGFLNASKPTLQDDTYFELISIVGIPNTTVTITMKSRDFDTYLSLGIYDEYNIFTTLVSDDNGGGGTDSQITYTFKDSRTYLIRANTVAAGETGMYDLKVVSDSRFRSISNGQTVTGELTTSSLKLDDNTYVDMYSFIGTPNTTVTVTLKSSDFDAYLYLDLFENDDLTHSATDDNDGGGTNSQIVYVIPKSGEYVIRVNAHKPGEKGSYSLNLQSVTGTPVFDAIPNRPITIGETISSTFTRKSARATDNSYYETYSIVGIPDESITITMKSDDFDPYLRFGTYENNRLMNLKSHASEIRYTFTDSRTYLIRANTVKRRKTGSYTLSVVSSTKPNMDINARLEIGDTHYGRFNDMSPTNEDERYYHNYTIVGQPNTSITIDLETYDFYSFLIFGSHFNQRFRLITTNSGGTQSKNSRITHRFTESGIYLIRVISLIPGERGSYTLKVTRN